MCTAICYGGLAGRTLDLEFSFGEEVVISPRGFVREYVSLGRIEQKNALIGTAILRSGVPMYYDAMSERGLYMAALNFPAYAVYRDRIDGMRNLASGELIPYILGSSRSLEEAKSHLREINITPDGLLGLPSTPMHWLLTDGKQALVAEPRDRGLVLTENPHGILTNAPNIEYQMTKLADFMHISPTNPQNSLTNKTEISTYSRGMGGIGIPGDFSSCSRFAKAAFLAANAREIGTITPQTVENSDNLYTNIPQNARNIAENNTNKAISTFFHITEQISVPYGCVLTDEGRAVYTVYTSCADLARGVYYLTTYSCRTPHAVALTTARATATAPLRFPHPTREVIHEF